MTLDELLNLVYSNSTPVCVDSSLVKEGNVFVALKGTVYDAHDFLDQAVANGAKFLVCRKSTCCKDAEVIIVKDPAKAAAALAQASRANPASQLTNLAVTGTNGKTTVAYLVRSCIRWAGQKCGIISTIIYDTGLSSCQANLTTPDCLAIADKQAQMLKAGAKYMVIEASSHALSQNRLAGIDFKAAAFTNLAGDHLDYHKTEADYLTAKTRLFENLPPDATAVLNKQSSHAEHIAQNTDAKILWYAVDHVRNSTMGRNNQKRKISNGVDAPADLTAHIKSMDITGTVFVLEYLSSQVCVRSSLLGRYNVSNHLAAAGLCLAAGFDLETVAAGLSQLKAIPGRLEPVDCGQDFSVFIDYAHTDDALKNVLTALRPLCKGRLTVVFGCGGDRDRTKRPRMAKVAERLADFIIVTSDNPRTEQPADIISEIVAGFENSDSQTIAIEPDRK